METLDGVKKKRKPSMNGKVKDRRRRALKRLEVDITPIRDLLLKESKQLGLAEKQRDEIKKIKPVTVDSAAKLVAIEDIISDYRTNVVNYSSSLNRMLKEVETLKQRI